MPFFVGERSGDSATSARHEILIHSKHHPNIILMDVMIPMLNGIEATRTLLIRLFESRKRAGVNARAQQPSPAGCFRPVYQPLLLSPAL
jgi:CheY-like chemotaxis protein